MADMDYEITNVPEQKLPEQESTLGSIARTVGGALARGAEAFAGFPGSIVGAAKAISNLPATFVSKISGEPIEETRKRIPSLFGPYQNIVETAAEILPTPESIREKVTKRLTGQTFEPRGAEEEAIQEFASDLGAMLVPIGGVTIKGIPKLAAMAGMGALAKNVAKKRYDAGPLAQEGVKLGTMLLTGFIGGKKVATNLMKEAYANAENELPKLAMTNAKELENKIDKISTQINKYSTPANTFLRDPIKEIGAELAGGKIDVKSAWQAKQALNELYYDYQTPYKAKPVLNELRNELENVLKNYGKESNPAFYKNYSQGNEIYSALKQQGIVQQFISQEKIANKIKNPYIKGFLTGGGALGALTHPSVFLKAGSTALTVGVPLLGIDKLTKIYRFLSKSPTALNIYSDLLSQAVQNNMKMVIQDVQKLDKSFAKYDKATEGDWEITS